MDIILEIIRSWHWFAQFLFLIFFATMVTSIILKVSGYIATFFNSSLPIILRGWPSHGQKVSDEDSNGDDDETDWTDSNKEIKEKDDKKS